MTRLLDCISKALKIVFQIIGLASLIGVIIGMLIGMIMMFFL